MYIIQSTKTARKYKKEKLPSRSKVAFGVILKEVTEYKQVGFVVDHKICLDNEMKGR